MIKLVILDIDGVLTDGKKEYDNNGNVLNKKFNDKDFTAIKRFKASGINVCFLSGDTNINKKMAELRNIPFYLGRNSNGKMNKIDILYNILNDFNVNAEDSIYVGDDIFDIEIFLKVGYSYCPNDSPNLVKHHSKVILSRNGGDGIVAELYDYLIDKQLISESTIEDVKNLDAIEGSSVKMAV
jgi:YrbI family 3-deoxy-D-manno-octulosonate 8-phosphate phosphatase